MFAVFPPYPFRGVKALIYGFFKVFALFKRKDTIYHKS